MYTVIYNKNKKPYINKLMSYIYIIIACCGKLVSCIDTITLYSENIALYCDSIVIYYTLTTFNAIYNGVDVIFFTLLCNIIVLF